MSAKKKKANPESSKIRTTVYVSKELLDFRAKMAQYCPNFKIKLRIGLKWLKAGRQNELG